MTPMLANLGTLNIPMGSVGFLDLQTGNWVMYQCNNGDSPVKTSGTSPNKMMGTGRLATCYSINFLSATDAILTHVPDY